MSENAPLHEPNFHSSPQCVAIARRAMAEGDIAKADKFSQKALRLFICKEARRTGRAGAEWTCTHAPHGHALHQARP